MLLQILNKVKGLYNRTREMSVTHLWEHMTKIDGETEDELYGEHVIWSKS